MSWKNLFSKKVRQMKTQMGASKSKDSKRMTSVYHLIVLDESGSMRCITRATISGCNETIQTIRMMQEQTIETQRHYVSIYLFDTTKSRYIIKEEKVDKVREITEEDYRPYAGTPLFDALGFTLTELKRTIEREKDTLGYVTIITDGYENASRQYNLNSVKTLIDELKEKNVIFSFIGANIDAADYGKKLHIDNFMQFEQTDAQTGAMWKREREARLRSNARYSFNILMEDEMSRVSFSKRENSGNYYTKKEVNPDRITPEMVTSLKENEIFVFGSNIYGIHSGGASACAFQSFGAINGQAEGLQGQSYAIPTDGVSLKELYAAVCRFHQFATDHPELTFFVTCIGCGTAGWSVYNIAPMFANCAKLDNVKLPKEFWDYL